VQRDSLHQGTLTIRGSLTKSCAKNPAIEVRLHTDGKAAEWKTLPATFASEQFEATLKAPAGGWYRLEVRASQDGQFLAETAVEHVGVGEVFVVAGQSNSANHGAEKQLTKTGRVASFDGSKWQLANDPQPGASGGGGSFLPPLGDALAARLDVPVGFVSCGIGATSVREWLPKGSRFPNPPTIESRVQKLESGEWESRGEAFEMFISRMMSLGPRGFRAVLWHQGESDANQRDTTRTLAGPLYREYLTRVIRESRREIGWDAPWFVAQVSYHVPGDEASPEIREAQASLAKDGIALAGPDSDSLKAEWREANGQGVHFSGPGLRQHAVLWGEKLIPWLELQLKSGAFP
jgi:Carbohydrate esterase, sialic acid-specific acetylesterase